MRARPVRYSLKLARRYCTLIAEGRSQVSVHQRAGMPSQRAAWGWMQQHPEFKRMYEAACSRRAMLSRRLGVNDPGRGGRPTLYSPEMALRICDLILEGRSLLEISRMAGMPHVASIHNWKHEHPAFDRMYRDAWETLAQHVADETVRIADEALDSGWPQRDAPGPVTAREALAHAKLKIDARMGRVLKLAPKGRADARAATPRGEAEMSYAERLALLR